MPPLKSSRRRFANLSADNGGFCHVNGERAVFFPIFLLCLTWSDFLVSLVLLVVLNYRTEVRGACPLAHSACPLTQGAWPRPRYHELSFATKIIDMLIYRTFGRHGYGGFKHFAVSDALCERCFILPLGNLFINKIADPWYCFSEQIDASGQSLT